MISKYEELDTLAVEVGDDDYVKKHFPKEKFIADQFVFQSGRFCFTPVLWKLGRTLSSAHPHIVQKQYRLLQ
jgi:hypothetical protein